MLSKIFCKAAAKQTAYIYGAGQRGPALLYFLKRSGIEIDGILVSDDRSKNQCPDLDIDILHISEVSLEDMPLILVAAADEEVRFNLQRLKIEYYDIPNYIFPFVKEYYETMSEYNS